jgi:hypothetical protein
VFHHLTLHGGAASLLWGYHTAVKLRAWRIAKHEGQWTLTATIERADAFMSRQSPLLFTAPHEKGRDGFWAWGVESVQVGPNQLVAKLGPPEQ